MSAPKDQLLNRTVGSGWKVIKTMQRAAGQTGGRFSTGYIVEKNGQHAFLKAMDLTQALLADAKDQFAAIRLVIDTIEFEGALLRECADKNLSRVVRLLEVTDLDMAPIDSTPLLAATSRVHVFIFELGGPDLRQSFGAPSEQNSAQRLKALHSIAVAIQQLHSIGVAHQDIKPSNVLTFNEFHKLTDLGRSTRLGVAGPSDKFVFPGDYSYCPPEFAYGHTPAEYVDRRFAADAYMLGSLISFLFTLQNTTALLQQTIHDQWAPPRWKTNNAIASWTGTFEDVLPHLNQAFSRVHSYVESNIPEFCRTELSEAFGQLCHPSPYLRGHPKSRRQLGRPLGIDRYVSLFDRLHRKAQIRVNTNTAVEQ